VQITLYAPKFAQLAEACLAQIVAGQFGKKRKNNNHNHNSHHSSLHGPEQQQQQHQQHHQQQHQHDAGAAHFAEQNDNNNHNDDDDADEDDSFVNGPQGEVYYKVKWEALRSYTLDLMDGPIWNTQKWSQTATQTQTLQHEDDQHDQQPPPPPPPCIPPHQQVASGESSSSSSNTAHQQQQQPSTTTSSSLSPPIILPQQHSPPLPTRETMLLYMERMKRGIDVIKTTFGPEWMYIWMGNEYGRALNARQHVDNVMRKHVALLAEAEQKVRHAVGHAYTDPSTQPIPLLTLRENLLRNKEGIMGIDYSESSSSLGGGGGGGGHSFSPYYYYYYSTTGPQRIIKPQFSTRPRSRSAPDYATMALEEELESPNSSMRLAQHDGDRGQHSAHEEEEEEEDDDDDVGYSHEATSAAPDGGYDNDNRSNDDAAVIDANFRQQQQQQYQQQQQLAKNKKSVRLLDDMDEMQPLCNNKNQDHWEPNDCNYSNADNNDIINNCTDNNAKSTTSLTATKTAARTAAAAAAAAIVDYVEPFTTEQDLARPRYETSPIRVRIKMQRQLAELENGESITARRFQDELMMLDMHRPPPPPPPRSQTTILRHGKQQQQQGQNQQALHSKNDNNNSIATSLAPPLTPPTPARPPPRPLPPPRPVMSVLERFMKQHDNAGNGLSQIVMSEISVLLWMMMDVGNGWTAMALHLLAVDREACRLVQDELDALVVEFGFTGGGGNGGGNANHCGEAAASRPLHQSLLFTPSVMSRMKYLDALLYEAIRLCPENLGGMKKTTQTVELPDAGVQIPKDTNIFFCQPT
jgi:hypothetical protein